MARVQRAVGLLRALTGSPALQNPSSQIAAGQQIAQRGYAVEPVAPAATYTDIEDEFYLRQRNLITLGNRHPNPAEGAWVSTSAVVVGDVDLFDRVSLLAVACAGLACTAVHSLAALEVGRAGCAGNVPACKQGREGVEAVAHEQQRASCAEGNPAQDGDFL